MGVLLEAPRQLRPEVPPPLPAVASARRCEGPTVSSRNNVAHAYRTTGDLVRAIPLFGKTAPTGHGLGADHPDRTLTVTKREPSCWQRRAFRACARARKLFAILLVHSGSGTHTATVRAVTTPHPQMQSRRAPNCATDPSAEIQKSLAPPVFESLPVSAESASHVPAAAAAGASGLTSAPIARPAGPDSAGL